MSDKSAIANYFNTKPIAGELRDQAIAAFLLAHADEYIEWVNAHIDDPVIKSKCLGFVAGVQSQLDEAALLVEHGQRMLAVPAASSGALMLQQVLDQALAEHPIHGRVLGVTNRSKELAQA